MAVLCANCHQELCESPTTACGSCGWNAVEKSGILYMLRSNELARLESDVYAANYDGLAKKNLEKSNIDRGYLYAQAQNILRYIGPVAGKSVCDLGVGQGFMASELLTAGAARVTGVDISESYLANLPDDPRLLRILANAENLPFYEEFDILTSTDVMEHVVDLGSFLYCINRAVKPNGIACIRVPYMKTVVHHSKFLGYPHDYGHLRSFDRKVLAMLMETAGFTVLRTHYDGFSLGMPNLFFRGGDIRRRLYLAFQRYFRSRVAYEHEVTRWNPQFARLFMMRNEIVVVARKTARIKKIEPQGYRLQPVGTDA